MINDFVFGKYENERAKEIIPTIKSLINNAREADVPIIYVCDTHSEDDHEFSIWEKHALEGTEGSKVIPQFEIKDEDYIVEKSKYSAFFGTELEDILENLGVEKVVLTGVLTHICVQHTAADAFFRGYDVLIPADAVEDVEDEPHEKALNFMKENYNVDVVNRDKLMESW